MWALRKNYINKGFTLIELLVVIGIIAALSAIAFPILSQARYQARDAERKAEILDVGRFFVVPCFAPSTGPGTYDVANLIPEFILQNPGDAGLINQIPKDPSVPPGNPLSRYMYILNGIGKCVVYANLENENEPVTLNYGEPRPGGGTGVFIMTVDGWNGTPKYFQTSS